MPFVPVSQAIRTNIPRGPVWDVIAQIAGERRARPGDWGWSISDWQRWCAAVEQTQGHPDQILAGPLWRTYRIVKELLEDGHGDEINDALKTLEDERQTKLTARSAPIALPQQLARGPRRRRPRAGAHDDTA